jgi:hypothetical protein
MKSLYLQVCYANMVQRCTNPKHPDFKWYGGRGILICSRWRGKFGSLHFYLDVLRTIGPRPEGLLKSGLSAYHLDRIDNDKGYQPGNIRWATELLSQRNKRPRRKKDFLICNVSAGVLLSNTATSMLNTM